MMGKLWVEMDNDDLILNYNCILWGLREEVHVLARKFDGDVYVVPVVTSTQEYETHIKSGMIAATAAIEGILKERDVFPIPKLALKVMSQDEADMKTLGWKSYINVKRIGLDMAINSNLT